jgi:hypothetical protein
MKHGTVTHAWPITPKRKFGVQLPLNQNRQTHIDREARLETAEPRPRTRTESAHIAPSHRATRPGQIGTYALVFVPGAYRRGSPVTSGAGRSASVPSDSGGADARAGGSAARTVAV